MHYDNNIIFMIYVRFDDVLFLLLMLETDKLDE
jgi:hypothetical protein